MTAKAVRPPKRKIFLYKKADLHAIDEVLSSFNEKLSEEYVTATDINELWLDFKQVLSKAMDRHIPSKMSSTRHNLPWVDSTIRRAIRKKQKLYNKARKSGTASAWSDFKNFRRSIDRQIREAHQTYIHNVIGESLKTDNTKPFWNYIKKMKQEVFGISSLTSAGQTGRQTKLRS